MSSEAAAFDPRRTGLIIAVRAAFSRRTDDMTTSLPLERLIDLYRTMLLNRLLEERLVNLYRQGKVVGGLYRSLGQEATSVATAFALDEGDILAPLIRNLGSVLARGIPARDILTQYMARATAPSGGKDANLHFSVPEKGVYSPIAMLGTPWRPGPARRGWPRTCAATGPGCVTRRSSASATCTRRLR